MSLISCSQTIEYFLIDKNFLVAPRCLAIDQRNREIDIKWHLGWLSYSSKDTRSLPDTTTSIFGMKCQSYHCNHPKSTIVMQVTIYMMVHYSF
ncbi:hypothetical protein An08g04230 [Aspergillus niger]|uniref:Uncharacterized protein n=2 Tax=Aspergillus niger TaxID=5061 RepID=A2QQZ3_ASPNC|nr:hypothetical protein An08g04230 [Aspergillus niger]CAK39925.1 hypothetical protein An08g04230 [Aspergillus niger]